MIEIRNIHTIKSGQKIFNGFSWTINNGENLVISGPNGGGKTSLLEVLSGKHVQSGTVNYDFITGESWEEQFQQEKQLIQYIPAHAINSLIPDKTDLYYQQRYYSIGDEISPVKVRDVLHGDLNHFQSLEIPATFDIEPLLDREIKRLSNGQLKKVLILQRLLHHLPRLLLLDYPFEGLDRQSRKDFCDFIDFIVTTYSIQVLIVDQGHELPKCITHRAVIEKFQIIEHVPIGITTIPDRPSPGAQTKTTNTQEVIHIRDLKIQYGDTIILKDFNWTVCRGDRWALIGPNGSGKTTLFSIIFADHPLAYSQQVFLFGRRRGTGESIWDIKDRINYLGPELLSYLDTQSALQTTRQYILAGTGSADLDKLDSLIRYFQADNFIDQPLRRLSSGQLQLALLMRCFMISKELLLLDEPFQFLAPEVRDRVADYLQQYLSDDITLILITHYENDLARWTEKTMRI